MNNSQLKLYLLTNINNQPLSQYISFIKQTVHGGVTMVQLREKASSYATMKTRALALQKLLSSLNIPLIINDSVELAAEIGADGVHLGNQDASVISAREKLGKDKIIGMSVENWDDLEQANGLPINYIAASTIYPSTSKLNCKKFWGIDGLKQLVEKSVHPVVAIGGINLNNVKDMIIAGAKGIALISAIHDSINPYQTAQEFRQVMGDLP